MMTPLPSNLAGARSTPRGRLLPSCLRVFYTGLAAVLSASLLTAQNPPPEDPPPWWGISDEDTVSLYWNFDNGQDPFTPTSSVLPGWYQPPPNNGFTTTSNVGWMSSLGGQQGVIGFMGSDAGSMLTEVDNDPRPDWIKLFWMQYDSPESSTGEVEPNVLQDLGQYDRALLSEKSRSLGNGWQRTTVSGYLIPQPDDETFEFSLLESAGTGMAIDNLFINSKCVKPPPDETGDAMGDKNSGAPNINAGIPTGNGDIRCATLTEDPVTGNLTYWVAGPGASGQSVNEVYRLDESGGLVGTPIAIPISTGPTPSSPTDLTVATLSTQTGRTEFVVGVIDDRGNNGPIQLQLIESQLATFDPSRTISVSSTANIGSGPLGLTFFPPGDSGQGTFWITDQTGVATEIKQDGTVRQQLTPSANGMPLGITGAGYDALLGRFYWFSDAPTATPQGTLRVAGYEHSAYDFQPTGTKFFADLNLGSGSLRGGVARGLDVARLSTGELQLLCVQRVGSDSFLTVLNGPFSFGWSLLGRCGMRGDPPMEGATNCQITLSGVPRARFAMLWAGFSNRISNGTSLPFNLAQFGMPESNVAISFDMHTPILALSNGSVAHTLPLPPQGSGFQYVPMFFQWVVFSDSLPADIGLGQSGKTVIY
ncbi:MAG: hypothetical protein VYE77_05025 [Planctomycetota bacterium]|nr:hypothetical protein [Planctomycetota bacterium]